MMHSNVMMEQLVMLRRAPRVGDVVSDLGKDVLKIIRLCAQRKVVVIKDKSIVVRPRVHAINGIKESGDVKRKVIFWLDMVCVSCANILSQYFLMANYYNL